VAPAGCTAGQREHLAARADAGRPAASLLARIPTAVAEILTAHSVGDELVAREAAEMRSCRVAKTENRSLVGIMTEFAFLADTHRSQGRALDLVRVSVRLAETPCSPLYATHVSPDRALAAVVRTAGRGPEVS
jgi:hypothetical protein